MKNPITKHPHPFERVSIVLSPLFLIINPTINAIANKAIRPEPSSITIKLINSFNLILILLITPELKEEDMPMV